VNILRISSAAVQLFVILFALAQLACADEFLGECSHPACGKVCRLVCEKKKLTSICYGCKSEDRCLPGPSIRGCKHCAVCDGNCAAKSAADCNECRPQCKFCWYDWFPCGCAETRSICKLKKYQAEKEIAWYHWEVVDAGCCNCGTAAARGDENNAKSAKTTSRTIFKPAPDDAKIGEVFAVTDEEWVKLAAILGTDPTEVSPAVVTEAGKPVSVTTSDQPETDSAEAKVPTFAERLRGLVR
jgi:hypothetical protein